MSSRLRPTSAQGRVREAVILMAGSGSRLRSAGQNCLKPLLSFLGRPLISYTLDALRKDPRLARMPVVQRGQRLSVQPVEVGEWRVVLELGGLDPDDF